MSAILEVNNLVKSYKAKKAVSGLSFQVKRGEIFGLLGPNGAGKSTTIECILGTKTATEGDIKIFGRKMPSPREKSYKDVISKVGVQFQKNFFLERIRVGEMCQMISALYEDVKPYEDLLDLFGLSDKVNQDISKLSGGEQQKLSLVLALIHKPDLVFLDELTTGLDPSARREVWEILKRLNAEGMSIVLTSHYMDEVTKLCDRIMVIKNGEMVYEGAIQEALKWTGTDNLEDAYLSLIGEENRHESILGVV